MRLRVIAFLLLLAAAVPATAFAGYGSPSAAKPLKFEAYLSGKVEVPKGAPAGKGTAKITITGTKVCWAFTGIKGISKVTAAHIHKGKAGKAGPVVVAFFAGPLKKKGCATAKAADAR